MKKHVMRLCLLVMAGTSALTVGATEEERMFLVAQLSSGQTASVMLGSGDNETERAILRHREGVLVLGSQVYQLSEVNGLRIEPRMVDGIEDVGTAADAEEQASRQGVYDLQGRKVADDDQLEGRLSRGIYIIHGKKVVVR